MPQSLASSSRGLNVVPTPSSSPRSYDSKPFKRPPPSSPSCAAPGCQGARGRGPGQGWGGGARAPHSLTLARWMLAPRPPRSAWRCEPRSPSLAPSALPAPRAPRPHALARPAPHSHSRPSCRPLGAPLRSPTPGSSSQAGPWRHLPLDKIAFPRTRSLSLEISSLKFEV